MPLARATHQNETNSTWHTVETDVSDQLQVMRAQEDSPTYKCQNYIKCKATIEQNPPPLRPIDEECRSKMVQWCYQIVEFAEFKLETVSIAMSFLDRFLSSDHPNAKKAIACRKEYQLSCITVLCIAIKMNERKEINPQTFSDLARGTHSESDIVRMETIILSALNWRLSGPTSFTYVHYLFKLGLAKLKSCSNSKWSKIKDLALHQVQLAVGDYFFVPYKPSILAVASILNSFTIHDTISVSDRMNFLQGIIDATDILPSSCQLWEVKNRLWDNLEKEGRIQLYREKTSFEERFEVMRIARDHSPICVSRSQRLWSVEDMRNMEFEIKCEG